MRARKIRTATEFDPQRLAAKIRPPLRGGYKYAWDNDLIFAARDAQMAGSFQRAVRMAEAMNTDDAIFAARQNRLAPVRCLGIKLADGDVRVHEEAVKLFGQDGVGITRETLVELNATLAEHGIAIAYNVATPKPDGSRVDVEVHSWPLEYVRVDANGDLVTRVDWAHDGDQVDASFRGSEVKIVHGDGRWIVIRKRETLPWRHDAAILPACLLVWAAHAHPLKDWNKASLAHGSAKLVGELTEGDDIVDESGNVSPRAAAFLSMLETLMAGESQVGIRPFGSKTDFVSNGSSAWQVFESLVTNRERAAYRIYLGTDGALGAHGGAPGVDIASLFNVSTQIIQGDLDALSVALQTGAIDVWAALNFGTSSVAPTFSFIVPDPDADADAESFAKREAAFHADVKALRENGFVVDDAIVKELAERYRIPVPKLASSASGTASFFAYELEGGIVTIDEVRASKGLAPLPNGAGQRTVPEARAGTMPATAAPIESASAADDLPPRGEYLAERMTELGLTTCEHGRNNRCPLCGIERDRDVEVNALGEPVWAVKWRAI